MLPADAARLTDIEMTSEGDLLLGADGDFALVAGADCVRQNVLFRLKTVQGDFLLQPGCGASLESFFGAPNSPETGAAMEAAAVDALTHDGFLEAAQIQAEAIPVNPTLIALSTVVDLGTVGGDTDTPPVEIVAALDLKEGQLEVQ